MLDDFDEPEEPEAGDVEQDDGSGSLEDNIVASGDAAAAQAGTTAAKKEESKQIPKDKRTTSPYMTKYERARVLGTRATQIR